MISGLWRKGILHALWHFCAQGMRKPLTNIVFTQETSMSILVGAFVGVFGHSFFPNSAKLLDVAIGFLGYAAIALGFCVGGMTIALTFPDRDFMKNLATFKMKDEEEDALSALLFTFSWTAVVHWFSLVIILTSVLVKGHQDQDLLSGVAVHSRILVGFVVAICSYALMQFVITVLTLWQVGHVYILELQKQARIAAK